MDSIKYFEHYVAENIKQTNMTNVFGLLFQSRDTAHLLHLTTKSFAQHKALNDYYDTVLDLIDKLVETWQGHFEIVPFEIPGSRMTDPINYFQQLKNKIAQARNEVEEISDIANILDELINEIASLLYKIKNLE